MAANSLRIEQYPTILFNTNLNPLGIPESVTKVLQENMGAFGKYPDLYYTKLKNAVCEYAGTELDHVVMGTGSSDMYRLFLTVIRPKKALILVPGPMEYERMLKLFGCEIVYYDLSEEDGFEVDIDDLCSKLDDSIDLVMISNPNNPTSRKIDLESIKKLLSECTKHNTFLVVDEMYIEFMDDYKSYTSVPLTADHNNLAVIRSVSKFFAVPGMRFAYAIINNPALMTRIDLNSTKNNLSSLTALAATSMFSDEKYISEGQSMVHTERSLVYLAMSTSKNIKLYKPDANFMLVQLLRDSVTSSDIADHCNQRGIIIRRCDDIRGLSNKFIRFCFMKPKSNDLMVNTILESV